jgi:hypothetical protein
MIQNITDAVPHVGVIATLAGWLPPIAAVFSIVWIALQIAEKLTGKPIHLLSAPVCEKVAAFFRRFRKRD